jgi:hypothetical protein
MLAICFLDTLMTFLIKAYKPLPVKMSKLYAPLSASRLSGLDNCKGNTLRYEVTHAFFLSSYWLPLLQLACVESKGMCYDRGLAGSQPNKTTETILFQFILATARFSASYTVHVVLDQLRDVLYRRS